MMRTDVAVVGAGPIGIELAVELKRAGVDYLHFDAGQIASTVNWYPRQVRFFSSPERIAIAGVPLTTPDQEKATREQYLAYLRGIVAQFDLKVRTYERVTSIRREGDFFSLGTRHGGIDSTYEARRIVLAIGDMARPRRLDIPGENLPHVSHYFDDPHPFFRQRLVIVGGRNSAVEAAIRCHRAGAEVTLSYRRDGFDRELIKYWLLPEIESFIRQGHIAFHPRTVPVAITENEIALAPVDGGPPRRVLADFVLLLVGYVADPALFELAGVALEGGNGRPVHDPATMETNVPGIYVAGTAAAGTQREFRLFIENSHVHVDRIVAALTGQPVRERVTPGFTLPES